MASMLLLGIGIGIGIGMVFAGVLCLTAVRGLAHGQRRAWDRAMIGSVLLLLVTLPITPHPTQGGMAGFLSFFAAVDLIVLLAAWRQLEAGQGSQHASRQPTLADLPQAPGHHPRDAGLRVSTKRSFVVTTRVAGE